MYEYETEEETTVHLYLGEMIGRDGTTEFKIQRRDLSLSQG